MVFIAPEVYNHVTPVIPIINGILVSSTVVFLFLTQTTDPGIIPRKEVFELYGEIP